MSTNPDELPPEQHEAGHPYEYYPEEVPPPSDREIMGLHTQKYMLDGKYMPKKLKNIFWPYDMKDASLGNYTKDDMDQVGLGFDCAKEIHQLSQPNPRAYISKRGLGMDGKKTTKKTDVVKLIDDQLNEDIDMIGIKDNLRYLRLPRGENALNLKLAYNNQGQPLNVPNMPRKPSRWAGIGKIFGRK